MLFRRRLPFGNLSGTLVRGAPWRIGLVVLIVLALGWVFVVHIDAQRPAFGWSPPVDISNTAGLSVGPDVTADQLGYVHVVWGEYTGPNEDGPSDTMYYTYLADGVWSEPVDVLAVAYGDRLRPDAFLTDPYGRPVLVWHQNQGLNVSVADALGAASARAWTTMSLDPSSEIAGADLAIDSSGVYHLIYVRDSRELVYAFSEDGGASWSGGTWVGGVGRDDLGVDWPCIAIDDAGTIYVSWAESAAANDWLPIGVWFTRSTDAGSSWDEARELAAGRGYTQSDLLVDGDQNVHLFWIGSLQVGGRYHRWSEDQGQTWSAPLIVAEPDDVAGMAGPGYLLLDSAGTLHVVFAGAREAWEQIWHSTWNGRSWRALESISDDLPNSQESAAAMAQGHRMHAVWVEYEGGDIWYASFDTGSPPLIVEPIPLAPASVDRPDVPEIEPSPVPQPTPGVKAMELTSEVAEYAAHQYELDQTSALLLGVLPSAAMVVLVVFAFQVRRRP